MQVPSVWFITLISSLSAALGSIITFIPRLLGAVVILLIGWGIGKLIQWVVTQFLQAVHFDRLTEDAGINDALQRAEIKTGPSAILGSISYWFVFLVAINAAVSVMGIGVLTTLMSSVILYLPRIFAALLITVFGAWAASFLARITRASAESAHITYASLLGSIVQGFALFFVFAVALEVLGLPFPFLTTAFAVILGALALTGALAFGLGGRQYAADLMAGRGLRAAFRAGDRVVAGDLDGTIQSIQPTVTVLRTAQGEVTVQNSELMHTRYLTKPKRGQGGADLSEAA